MSRNAIQPQQKVLFHIEEHKPKPPEEEVVSWDFLGSRVRTVRAGLETWFVLADVAKILGYGRTSDAVKQLREHQKGAAKFRTLGGTQDLTIISIGGLNRLILRCNHKNAEPFQDWVTDVVLTSIMRDGHYSLKNKVKADPIRKEMNKGLDRETAKARVESKSINKGEHKELSKNGAKPSDYAAYHNAVYRGAFNMDAKGLRKALELKKGYRETPLDHMDVVALSITNLAKALASKACQELGIDDIPGKCEKLEAISKQVASDSLSSLEHQTKREHVIAIDPDRQRGKKIIAAVPLQLPRPA